MATTTNAERFTPEQLRKRSNAVYLACEESVAADLSACLMQAADDAERASTLEDAAFHFQTCHTCKTAGEDACESGGKFAAFLRGEAAVADRSHAERDTMMKKALAYWPWVRFRRTGGGYIDQPRWLWTPITYRFGHGGWIYLSLRWFWRFRNGAR